MFCFPEHARLLQSIKYLRGGPGTENAEAGEIWGKLTSANTKTVSVVIAAVVIGSAVLGAYLISETINTPPGVLATLQTITSTSFAQPAHAQTTNSTLGLELLLSVNSAMMSSGQTINVSLILQNTLPLVNNVCSEWDWASASLSNFSYSTFPCPRWGNFEVLAGDYGQNEISSATPLFLWPVTLGYPSCPFLNFSNYVFQPQSNVVNVSSSYPPNYDYSLRMNLSSLLTGYYLRDQGSAGSNRFPPPTLFPAGSYTIVAGDEWGQTVILHFVVMQGTTTTIASSSCQAIGRVVSAISTEENQIGGPIAYDTHLNEIYATGQSFDYLGPGASNNVYVVNPSTNSSTATIAVGTDPTDIAFDPGNNNLYVTNFGSNTVSVISDESNSVIGNISVGSGPIKIAYDPDNQHLYVSNRNSGTVSVINATTNSVTANIMTTSSSPFEIEYDSFNHNLYVTDGRSGDVTIISSSSNKVVGSFSIGQGSGLIAYDSANNDLYFFPQDSQVLYVINGSDDRVIGNVSNIHDLNAMGYDPAGSSIFVAGNASGGFVDVISGTSGTGSVVSSIIGENWVPVDFAFVNGTVYLGTNYGTSIPVLSSSGESGVSCTNLSYTQINMGGGGPTTIITEVTTAP